MKESKRHKEAKAKRRIEHHEILNINESCEIADISLKSRSGKRIWYHGKYFRRRRGKLVQIPDEWVGHVTHPQTIKKRHSVSKRTRKRKKKYS